MNPDDQNHPTSFTSPPGMRGYWIIALVLAIAGWFGMRFDFDFAQPDSLNSLPGDISRVLDLSELFAHGFGVVLVAIGIWSLVPDKRRYLPRIIACVAFPGIAVQLIKHWISRDRPVLFLQPDLSVQFPQDILSTWHGWLPGGNWNSDYFTQSFPSAHTATVCGLAIGLSWAFPRGRLLFFSIALLGSLQRITSLAHWSSDVCFGAAIGFLMAGALTHDWGFGRVLRKFETRFETDETTEHS